MENPTRDEEGDVNDTLPTSPSPPVALVAALPSNLTPCHTGRAVHTDSEALEPCVPLSFLALCLSDGTQNICRLHSDAVAPILYCRLPTTGVLYWTFSAVPDGPSLILYKRCVILSYLLPRPHFKGSVLFGDPHMKQRTTPGFTHCCYPRIKVEDSNCSYPIIYAL